MTRTFIDILINPELKILFVCVSAKAESSTLVEPFVGDSVQPKVLVISVSHIRRVEVYLWMQSEDET